MVLPDLRSAFSCSLLFPQFSSLVRHPHPLEGLLRHRVSKAGCLGWDSGACTSNKFPGDTEAADPGATLWEPWWHSAWRMIPGTSMACIWRRERHGGLGQYPAFSHHPRCPQAVSSSTEHLGGLEADGTRLYHTHSISNDALSSPRLHTSSNKMPTTCQGRLPHRQLFLMSSNLSPPTYGCQIKYRMPG